MNMEPMPASEPLCLANVGTALDFYGLSGSAKLQSKLRSLGFTPGKKLQIVNNHSDFLVVLCEDEHVVLSTEMAKCIWVR